MPYVNPKIQPKYDNDYTVADATPTNSYGNSNMQSNINSIFIPVSTSKYPIKQSTISEDFHERLSKFVVQWKKTLVYLSRK